METFFIYAVDNKFKTSPATPGLNRIHMLKLEIDEAALGGGRAPICKTLELFNFLK